MNNLNRIDNLKIIKIVCYQLFYTDSPPTIEQQDDFIYCDKIMLWLSDHEAIQVGSYMVDSNESDYACSISLRRLTELPYSWQSDRERLMSCENIKELVLEGFRNCLISSSTFYGKEPIIQSLEIHFTNDKQIHVFSGDCYEVVNGKPRLDRDDEFLFIFFNESNCQKYGLKHKEK